MKKNMIKCQFGHTYENTYNNLFCPVCCKYSKQYIQTIIQERRNRKIEHDNFSHKNLIQPCCLYIIKLSNSNESFYKIGHTSKALNERFKDIPYKIEAYKLLFTNRSYAIDIERYLHDIHDEFCYAPQIGFMGCSECFSCIFKKEIDKIDQFNKNNLEYMRNNFKK